MWESSRVLAKNPPGFLWTMLQDSGREFSWILAKNPPRFWQRVLQDPGKESSRNLGENPPGFWQRIIQNSGRESSRHIKAFQGICKGFRGISKRIIGTQRLERPLAPILPTNQLPHLNATCTNICMRTEICLHLSHLYMWHH